MTEIFETYIPSKNPHNRETLYHKLYASLTAQHPDYVIMGIISAFDIALWGICRKYYNTPVYNLLGGRFRDRIRTYTYIYDKDKTETLGDALGAWTTDPQRLGELASSLADEGFTGLKFAPLPQVKWKETPLKTNTVALKLIHRQRPLFGIFNLVVAKVKADRTSISKANKSQSTVYRLWQDVVTASLALASHRR